jgi:trimeric autotransporter adhesin
MVTIPRRRSCMAPAVLVASAVLTAGLAALGSTTLDGTAYAAGAPGDPARPPGTISTIGGGNGGPGSGTTVSMGRPCALTWARGSLYLDTTGGESLNAGVLIRRISARTGRVSTPVGSGVPRHSPDGTPAALTTATTSCGVAVDSAGNVIWSETAANRVRLTAARSGTFYGRGVVAGRTYTIAGNGTGNFTGNAGPATATGIHVPAGIALDRQGNIVFTASYRILVIPARAGTFYGQTMTAGDIYSIAGGGSSAGNGIPATSAMLQVGSFGTTGVRVDRHGNVVFSDPGANIVQVVAETSGQFYGRRMTAGDLYTIAGTGRHGDSGDGHPARRAELRSPQQLTLDHAGNVIFSEPGRVRMVAARNGLFYGVSMHAGDIYTLRRIGDAGLSVDAAGNLVIASAPRDRDSWVRVLGNRSGRDFGQPVTRGRLTVVAGNGKYWASGNGGLAARAQFESSRMAADAAGDLAVSEQAFHGTVGFIPHGSGDFFGRTMTAGHIYAIAGNGRAGCGKVTTGPALRSGIDPAGLAIDAHGNVVVADLCKLIRVIADRTGRYYGRHMVAGDIYTIAGGGSRVSQGAPARRARFRQPGGVAVDAAGNILVADYAAGRVKVIATSTGAFYGMAMQAGKVYTIAGNGSSQASGDGGKAVNAGVKPLAVTLGGGDDVLVTDGGGTVRLIAEHTGMAYGQAVTAGDIYTVAGGGSSTGDGGPATGVELHPSDVHVDASGNLLIADFSRVLVVAGVTGTFYEHPMTAGDIYTIAGSTAQGFSGDDGPAVSARLYDARSVTVVPAGVVFLDGDRIRLISG